MKVQERRIPLKDGTILCTADGRHFHILHSSNVGGSAILYTAQLDGSEMDLTLKEFYPDGCIREDGVVVKPKTDAVELQESFYQQLDQQAREEMKRSQQVYSASLHAVPHLEQLTVNSICQPGEPVRQAENGGVLPCVFLCLPTLNSKKGFFLQELLDECAAYPRSAEHPFGALEEGKPSVTAAPDILTTLKLIRLVLEALQTLHKTAIHGDISLGNFFIDGDLRPDDRTHTDGLRDNMLRGVVFLDFGSARLLDASSGKTAPILPEEKVYTTPLFCAPEIRTGIDSGEAFCLTPAADIYSVGVLLRFLLRKEALAAYRKQFYKDLEDELEPAPLYPTDTVPSVRPVVPELNRILCAASEEDPEKRCTAEEMLRAVDELCDRLSAPRFLLEENLSSSDQFVPHSRDAELKELNTKMEAGMRPIFVWGLGGIGKTETAREFLRACRKNGRRVAFFSYEKSVRSTILSLDFTGYEYHPSKSRMTPEEQENEQYREKLGLLAGLGQDAVIVMDNFDSDTQMLDEMRQEPAYRNLIDLRGPHLIITTRFDPDNDSVEIHPLADEVLLKLMLKELDMDKDANSDPVLVTTLRSIIDAIQGHTLTCYLIAKSIKHNWGLTAQDVLDALNQYNLHSLKQRPVSSDKDRKYTKDTIYGHLKVLFDLSKMMGAYRAALCHMVILPQKGIEDKLFLAGESSEEQEALMELAERGWIQRVRANKDIHLLTLHPLIRELIINELQPVETDYKGYLSLICKPDFLSMQEANSIAMRKLDLAQSVLSLSMLSPTPEVALDCCITGYHDFKRGRRRESVRFYDKGLEIYERLSRTDQTYLYRYADESGRIGFLMSATNEYQQRSAVMLRQAVSIWKKLDEAVPGKYQEEYANACDNLGYQLSLSRDAATHREAEAVLREALKIRRKLYQKDPDAYRRVYAWTTDNLGKVLTRDSKSFSEADQLLRESLAIREELNRASGGKNISEIAWTCHNLGQLLATKPEYHSEAEEHYRRSIKLRQELDRLDPGTHAADASWAMLKLADLLAQHPERRSETKELYRNVLNTQRNIEKEHPGMFVLDADRVRRQYADYLCSLPDRTPEEEEELQKLK